MANETEMLKLVPGQELALPDFQGHPDATPESFNEIVKSPFMPRLALMAGTSDLVTKGKMNVGKFALVYSKEDFVDLGDSFNCIPFCWRHIAMRFGPPFEAYYDSKSDEFKEIQVESQESDSGCAFGPQFLVWVPQLKEFATYTFSSQSARPEARKMEALKNKGATIQAKLITVNGTPPRSWHVPKIIPCQIAMDLPPLEKIQAEVDKFNNPPKSETEEAPAPAGAPGTEQRAR